MARLDESGVVAVDHLTHEIRVRVARPNPVGDLRPEAFAHRVGGVQPPPGDAAVQPVDHHLDHVVHHGRLCVVERHQMVVALEVLIVGLRAGRPRVRTSRPVQVEPGGCRGRRASGQHSREGAVRPGHVVEHPVQHHPDPPSACGLDQRIHVRLVAQARVDPEMVDSVVDKHRRGRPCAEDCPRRCPTVRAAIKFACANIRRSAAGRKCNGVCWVAGVIDDRHVHPHDIERCIPRGLGRRHRRRKFGTVPKALARPHIHYQQRSACRRWCAIQPDGAVAALHGSGPSAAPRSLASSPAPRFG